MPSEQTSDQLDESGTDPQNDPQNDPDDAAERASVPDRRTVRIKFTPQAASEARAILVDDLTERGVDQRIIDESVLVASELVANAIRHSQPLQDGTVRLHWKVKGDIVEVEVGDGGGEKAPKVAPPTTWSTSGRGLRIVRAIAHEWGVIDDDNGYTVWACMGGPSRRRTQ